MRSSSSNSRRNFGRPFEGNSPFLIPFALPVKPVLDGLNLSPSSVVVEIGAVACRFTLPIARYIAIKKGTGFVHACELKEEGFKRTVQKIKDAHLEHLVTPYLWETASSNGIPVESLVADVVITFSMRALNVMPTVFLAECFRVLRPGGRLFIAEWRDTTNGLCRDERDIGLPKEAAWKLLESSSSTVCTAINIPELEWAVMMEKPLIQPPS